MPYHDKIKEGIIRALGVKEATGKASQALIAEYNKTPKDKMNLRWVIGNTIYNTITKADVESILAIVQNKENGYSRQPFIVALGKIKSDKVEDILIKLLDDEEVTPYAIVALGKMRSIKAKEKIEQLLTSTQRFVKKEAEKALKRIEAKQYKN